MECNDIRDKMRFKVENPLLDINEDISERPIYGLSFFEKIGLASSLFISIVILIIAGISLFIDFFIKSDYLYVLIDMLIVVMCSGAVYFIFNVFRKKVMTEILIDTAFQEGVYKRLQSLVENIAQAHVDTNIMLDRMSNMDMKIENILKDRYTRDIKSSDLMQEPLAIGTSIKFAIKAIFLIVISMAVFMFLINFNLGGITPYAVLLIFILWWGFITNEYKLWKETHAWSMVFFPVLVVPVTVMLLYNLLNYNVLIATLYLSLGVYTFIYYLWAIYASTGSLPFITMKKQEPAGSEFFALQQRGLLKDSFAVLISRLEKQLQEDEKKKELKYAWKK